MDEGKDIYRVSACLVAGALFAWGLKECVFVHCADTLSPAYLLSAFLVVLIAAALSLRDHLALWWAIFFMCGMLCFLTDGILSVPCRLPLSGLSLKIGDVVDDIPFEGKENNALVKALILGDRSSLGADTLACFRAAGAAHLLALSGMHLGIIYLIVNKFLIVFGNSIEARRIRRIATILICGFYTLMCGAGASLVRAWLFIALRETGLLLDRPQDPRQIFCSALTIHVIFSPSSVSSISFQLSYLAMVGIVFIWPFCREWVSSRIWEAASLSICCQLFTAPLTLLYFGTFPKYFLITNLVAAPLTGIVMGCGIASVALTALWPDAALTPSLCTLLEFPITLFRELLGIIARM